MKVALPRLSTHEICVLKQLHDGAKYGLQLVDGSNGMLSRRAIYVLLHRMNGKKLIARESTFAAPEGETGPTRVTYRITERGARALLAYQAWMAT